METTTKTLLGYAALVLGFFAYPVLWLLMVFHVPVPSKVAWWLAVLPHVVLGVFAVVGFCRLLMARTRKRIVLWLALLLATLLALGWTWLLAGGLYMRQGRSGKSAAGDWEGRVRSGRRRPLSGLGLLRFLPAAFRKRLPMRKGVRRGRGSTLHAHRERSAVGGMACPPSRCGNAPAFVVEAARLSLPWTVPETVSAAAFLH